MVDIQSPSDFTQSVNDLKIYANEFTLSPKQLKGFSIEFPLQWEKVEFTPDNSANIPETRGIYAFVIEHNTSYLPPHGYIMYVGMSGDKSQHNLRKRYKNYLSERKNIKRSKIHYMLNNWKSCLFFHYAEVMDPKIDLKRLEEGITDALIPPCNDRDFSGPIRKAKKAF